MSGIETKVLSAIKKAGKPVKAGEIAEITGISKDEVARAIAKLKKLDQIKSPKACFYIPADQ